MITNRRPGDAAACPSARSGHGYRIGELGQLGIDQEVGTGWVESERNAVRLDRHADFGRPTIIARARQSQASVRHSLDRPRRAGIVRRPGPGLGLLARRPELKGLIAIGLAAEFDQAWWRRRR